MPNLDVIVFLLSYIHFRQDELHVPDRTYITKVTSSKRIGTLLMEIDLF